MIIKIHGASFRDPSGFVFRSNGTPFRRINRSYAQNYDLLMGSGLYAQLTAHGALVEHAEVDELRFKDAVFSKLSMRVKLDLSHALTNGALTSTKMQHY